VTAQSGDRLTWEVDTANRYGPAGELLAIVGYAVGRAASGGAPRAGLAPALPAQDQPSRDSERLPVVEEASPLTEQLFRLALKNAPVSVAAQDRELRFTWAYNQRTVQPAEVIGKTDVELFPPDTASRLTALKRRVLETGTELVEQMWVVSGNHHLYLSVYIEPIRNEAGEITGIGIATVDLTERKRAEEALRASEEKFATAFHLSPDAIGIVRVADSTPLDVNEAFTTILGFSRSDVVGRSWTELGLLATSDERVRITEQFLEKGHVADYELSLTTKTGGVATVLLSLIAIAVSGEPCILAIAHDITKRKHSEEALRQVQEELTQRVQERTALEERQRLARELHDSVSQALYGISLGVNTALTLLDTDRSKVLEALQYTLELTHDGLTEMRALIFELRPESLRMEGLVTALARQTAAVSARYNIEVGLIMCDEPDVSLAVKEALFRIAQEALQNAARHARSDRLDVRLAREPSALTLEVCDNGVGFDPAAPYPGHLGLHSMRERAMKAGGTLDIISAPDCGTQVRVHIPVSANATTPSA
jgi:PAS domain S-box-containing protein